MQTGHDPDFGRALHENHQDNVILLRYHQYVFCIHTEENL